MSKNLKPAKPKAFVETDMEGRGPLHMKLPYLPVQPGNPQKNSCLLRPLEVSKQPWKDLSMHFIVGLPECEGFDTLWVVVDRLTKMQHLVPCTDKVDGEKLGEMYVKEAFRLHGLSKTIVFNRGLQLALKF
jgi:hypothetical protein